MKIENQKINLNKISKLVAFLLLIGFVVACNESRENSSFSQNVSLSESNASVKDGDKALNDANSAIKEAGGFENKAAADAAIDALFAGEVATCNIEAGALPTNAKTAAELKSARDAAIKAIDETKGKEKGDSPDAEVTAARDAANKYKVAAVALREAIKEAKEKAEQNSGIDETAANEVVAGDKGLKAKNADDDNASS